MEDLWVVFFPGIVRRSQIEDCRCKVLHKLKEIRVSKNSWGSPENLLGLPPQFPTLLTILCSKTDSLKFLKIDTSQFHLLETAPPSRSAFACALSSTSIRIPGSVKGQGRNPPQMGFFFGRLDPPISRIFVKRVLASTAQKGPYVGLCPGETYILGGPEFSSLALGNKIMVCLKIPKMKLPSSMIQFSV